MQSVWRLARVRRSENRIPVGNFPREPRPALGFTKPLIQWVTGLFPAGKAAGEWSGVDHTALSNAQVKKTNKQVQLYSRTLDCEHNPF